MIEIDTSLTLTGVVALSAIISPVVVTLINNRHALKMKKIEIKSEKQAQAVKRYLTATGKILELQASSNSHDYQLGKGFLYLYAPKSAWIKIDKLDEQIKAKKYDDARKTFADVCKALSKE